MKRCRDCPFEAAASEFPKGKPRCWNCQRAYDRERDRLPHRRARQQQMTPARRETVRRAKLKWLQRNPEKNRAQSAVNYHIERGNILREPCEGCGAEKAEAHHDDYSKPLEIRWLCRGCHAGHHVRERSALLAT